MHGWNRELETALVAHFSPNELYFPPGRGGAGFRAGLDLVLRFSIPSGAR